MTCAPPDVTLAVESGTRPQGPRVAMNESGSKQDAGDVEGDDA